jgi:hypothetical protein
MALPIGRATETPIGDGTNGAVNAHSGVDGAVSTCAMASLPRPDNSSGVSTHATITLRPGN